ncbi:MAG TPA: YciI family protein [Spirochaetia bacterium]|nr:YciI family protein [Spirochaetia bacterium]
MKYLCIGYGDKAKMDALPKEELTRLLHDCVPYVEKLNSYKGIIMHSSISWDVTTIRPVRGKPVVTDGPFVEIKEQMGSFFIIEAPDMQEAIRIASLHPSANMGEDLGFRIEVRAFGDFDPEV